MKMLAQIVAGALLGIAIAGAGIYGLIKLAEFCLELQQ